MNPVTAFILPSALPLRRTDKRDDCSRTTKQQIRRLRRTRCMTNSDSSGPDASSEQGPSPSQPSRPYQQFGGPPELTFGRFDAEADTDAFGRDPKKETEFWKDHAKSVLESTEVREAIEKHQKDGGNDMTDEQRAYMEFIRKLDEGKPGEEKSDTGGDVDGRAETR